MNARVDVQSLLELEAMQGVATVVAAEGHSAIAQYGGRTFSMRVAASCLLLPAAGDLVWWCADHGDADGTRWITQLLERAGSAAPTLQLPADTTLCAGGGFLRIVADDLRLESDALQIKTRQARLLFDTAEAVGACWQAVVGALRWTGSSIAAVVGNVTLAAKTHQRFTEGSDTVRAGTLDLRAQGLATLHAEHVLIEGERLVKARAPQIHMG